MLNPLFLNQLISKKPDLHDEIMQILHANNVPMTCLEIFEKSEVAVTSRDISLEMQRNLKTHGMVEIDRKVIRPGTAAEVAYWKLTQAGIDALNEKQSPGTPAEKVEAPATQVKEQEMQAETKTIALQVLEYIEQNPDCTMPEIQEYLNNPKIGPGNIVGYLNAGQVIKTADNGRIAYSIASGFKVSEFYGKRRQSTGIKRVSDADKPTKVPPYKIVPYDQVDPSVKARSESLNNVSDTDKPVLEAPLADETKKSGITSGAEKFAGVFQDEILSAFQKEKPAAPSQFRVAYTSDGCLIIMGLHIPIELDAAQTRELINYVDDMKLSEVA